MTIFDRLFVDQTYGRIASFTFVLGSVAGFGFNKLGERYPAVYIGYSAIIGLSSIVAFGYYANLLKSAGKGRFPFYSTLVLSVVNPLIRLLTSSILYAPSGYDFTNNAITFYTSMFLYGATYIVFGIGQLQAKELAGKSTQPLGTMAIVFGVVTLIHNLVVRRLAPLALVSNLIVWGIFLYLLFPRGTKKT